MTTETKEYLTKDKYEELKKKIEDLRTRGRKEVAEELEYAKQLGDLSENAEYHSAREKQAMLEDEISRLDNLLKSAVIVDNNSDKHTGGSVTVGSIVELQREGMGDTITYTIVGSEEADMSKKKLSTTSPLGQEVRGKKKGETFSLKTPGGMVKYKIVNIS